MLAVRMILISYFESWLFPSKIINLGSTPLFRLWNTERHYAQLILLKLWASILKFEWVVCFCCGFFFYHLCYLSSIFHQMVFPSSFTLPFSRYDIVVDVTDNAPSRYMISDCCVLLGKVMRLLTIILLRSLYCCLCNEDNFFEDTEWNHNSVMS